MLERRKKWLKELINQKKHTEQKFTVLEQEWRPKAAETFSQEEETKAAKNFAHKATKGKYVKKRV